MNSTPATGTVVGEKFDPAAFDAELVDFLGQFIANLNEVIRLQQARIKELKR